MSDSTDLYVFHPFSFSLQKEQMARPGVDSKVLRAGPVPLAWHSQRDSETALLVVWGTHTKLEGLA